MSLFFSPPSDCSSLPSTMTCAPCPHGVRTRGKKTCNGSHAARTQNHCAGTPHSRPVAYHFDGAEALQQSLFSLFALLITGDAPRHCPSATALSMKLCRAARTDSAHVMSVAFSLAAALQTGRSTLAVAGVFGAGKTRSLTFLLVWLAPTTNLKNWSGP